LKEYLIGTGGWAYFQVPGLSSLVAYSRVFNFVEVNSTFYQMPPLKEVEKWRKLVPQDFKFSVRAHRSITHQYKLQPVQEAYEALDRMKQICGVLNADVLHLQTPVTFRPTEASINDLHSFLASANLGKLRIALEMRGVQPSNLSSDLVKTMQDFNVIHSVDLSKGEMPAYESDILYTRLFGKGQHNIYQPLDGELAEICHKAASGKSEKVAMSFHFVRMYKDAARLKIYTQTGKFPMVTRSTGVTSLEEVLSEDAKFPTTKQQLVDSQGWKLFDLTKTERTRVAEFLEKLPKGAYNNMDEVTEDLKQLMR
jgi:uncharacterized protein YecE (DUF72 family)